jgi:type II secretory pathway pseudopilin PulG
MDKKNIIIIILLIALVAAIYFAFQNTQPTQEESSATNVIPPSQELKTAYEESSQHSAMADIAELSCFPTSRFDCGGGSCTPTAPATYFFVDYGTESGTYFRCDAKGCDPYPVEVNQSGEFTQFIPSQGQAMLFKVATGDILGNKGEFIDVVTLGTGTIISSGKCEFK